ncbi:MAG: DUF87 domain-containing protein [Hyphomicrobiaceae bacterium]
MPTQLDAIKDIGFRSFTRPDDVWRHETIHVEGLHAEAYEDVLRLYCQIQSGQLVGNVVIQGRPGVGKTHFLGQLRSKVMSQGDLFVLVQLASARQFWHSLVDHYLSAFARQNENEQTQLAAWSAALISAAGLCEALSDRAARSSMFADEIAALRPLLREHVGKTPEGRRALDVFVAVLLQATEHDDVHARDVGMSFLLGIDVDPESQRRFGFATASVQPREVISALDRLTARAGKVGLVCIDQLDGLVAVTSSQASDDRPDVLLLNHVANGLMDLAEDCPNSLVVLSCLPDTWILITENVVQSAAARFPEKLNFRNIPAERVGRDLIAAYFETWYRRVEFSPPYPTWPILPQAFDDIAGLYSPRELIGFAAAHVRKCRQAGEISELAAFPGAGNAQPGSTLPPVATAPAAVTNPAPIADDVLARFDAAFEASVKSAAIDAVFDEKQSDTALPPLLQAGLQAWIAENDVARTSKTEGPPGRNPPLHARLCQTLNADTEDEAYWSFRAVFATHPRSALTQLRRAIDASGLGLASNKRRLVILRNEGWSAGSETQKAVAELQRLGGTVMPLERADVAVFSALAWLQHTHVDALTPWLRARRPASGCGLLAAVLKEHANSSAQPTSAGRAPTRENRPQDSVPSITSRKQTLPAPPARLPASPPNADAVASIELGRSPDTGKPITMRLEDLRRHTAIFAGPGSGKTVFLRRMIEECALAGVSSIVLDPNNDLARLGMPWPEAPLGWQDGDAERSKRYLETAEVVIWTPRRATGRPLSFQPLGNLNAVIDDPEEFALAIESAVATLLPRAGLPRSGARAVKGQAVLSEALRRFVLDGGTGLKTFLAYLGNLPADVSTLADGVDFAHDMGQTLQAATVIDPMFGGDDPSVDPGVLLTPSPGKRARVSVISFVGLPNDDQRQGFVNQLQMALFAWAKLNPAGDRPLGGLYVMDEAQTFAPASPATACSQSTRALAAQARKYGLGLVFATQAPKGIHNQIVGAATTHVHGCLNAPAQQAAAREMAQSKGGDVADIGKLKPGQFYVASERIALQKIVTPNCLSFHPKSPLTPAEVLDLARAR